MSQTILKSDFNEAVQAAIAAVKPLLLAAEAANPGSPELAALHSELATQLGIADSMGSTGIHTLGGGTDKGDN